MTNRTNVRRRARLIAPLAALSLLAAACGGDDDSGGSDDTEAADVTSATTAGGGADTTIGDTAGDEPDVDSLTFVTQVAETEEAAIEKVAALYEEQTGVKVDVQFMAGGDIQLLLTSQVESGNVQVDVAGLPNDQLYPYVSGGLVEDLTEFESTIDPAVPAQLVDGGRVDGKLLFVPYRGGVLLTYYNTALFEKLGLEPPEKLEEWKTVCQALADDAGEGRCLFQAAFDPPAVNPTQTWEWIAAYGGDPTVLNDEGTIAAYTLLQEIQQAGLFNSASALAKWDTSNEDFARGDAALMQNWPFGIDVLKDLGVSDFKVYHGAAGPAGEFHVVGGDVLAIVKDTPKKQAAWEFIQFLEGAEAQGILASENSWPTFRPDALTNIPAERMEEFQAMTDAMSRGIMRPNTAWMPDLYQLMIEAWDRIVNKGEDAKTVLDELAGKLAELKGS